MESAGQGGRAAPLAHLVSSPAANVFGSAPAASRRAT
jgi:hypothetical protein